MGFMDRIKSLFGGDAEPAATEIDPAQVEEEVEVSEVWNDIEQERMAAMNRPGDPSNIGRP